MHFPMDSSAPSPMRSNMDRCTHPGVHPCTQPCAHSVMRSPVESPMRSGMDARTKFESGQIVCQRGLSAAQICVISVLQGIGRALTSYKEIALALEANYSIPRSPTAVRGIVDRLTARGLLQHQRKREGMIQGVIFELAECNICPHIHPSHVGMDSPMRSVMDSPVRPPVDSPMQSPMHTASPILKILNQEKKDRKNLSISSQGSDEYTARLEALTDDDMAFHWPELTRAGFGSAQIRQILMRLAQVGGDTRHIMQGLAHAEWALAHNAMRDKNGDAVTSPANWVFKILATQGYYPRPSGYVSPAEQADRDRLATLEKEREASSARFAAECEAWAKALPSSDREAILGQQSNRRFAIPEDVRLRQHFRDKVFFQKAS